MEVEGGIWLAKGAHNTGKAIERDIEKYNRAQLLGWRVFRVVPSEVHTIKTVQMLRLALNRNPSKDLLQTSANTAIISNNKQVIKDALRSLKSIVGNLEKQMTD